MPATSDKSVDACSSLPRRLAAAAATAALWCATSVAADESAPQRATAADMQMLFAPIIGVFRSPDYLYDDGKTEHHFRISYEWFNPEKTVVKFTVVTVIPSLSRTITSSEGFYWFDPVRRRIAVFGAFARGTIGTGAIGQFDHMSRKHSIWATTTEADGTVTHVRDAFEVIDGNSWRNVTTVRSGDDEEWKVVHEGTYNRVQE